MNHILQIRLSRLPLCSSTLYQMYLWFGGFVSIYLGLCGGTDLNWFPFSLFWSFVWHKLFGGFKSCGLFSTSFRKVFFRNLPKKFISDKTPTLSDFSLSPIWFSPVQNGSLDSVWFGFFPSESSPGKLFRGNFFPGVFWGKVLELLKVSLKSFGVAKSLFSNPKFSFLNDPKLSVWYCWFSWCLVT